MNREIKFRGLYNGQWVYGSLIKRTVKGQVDYQIEHADFDDFRQYDVVAESAGEYTGLKDKNGTEIYEGDILKNLNRTWATTKADQGLYVVEWQEGEYGPAIKADTVWLRERPGFRIRKIGDGMSLIFGQHQIEVIGNIHQNPELLNP